MRIRRENKGGDIVVEAICEIDKFKPADNVLSHPSIKKGNENLDNIMNDIGIPLAIEMATRLFNELLPDLIRMKSFEKIYKFTLVCQDISDES